jgi:hypothetical protein
LHAVEESSSGVRGKVTQIELTCLQLVPTGAAATQNILHPIF